MRLASRVDLQLFSSDVKQIDWTVFDFLFHGPLGVLFMTPIRTIFRSTVAEN